MFVFFRYHPISQLKYPKYNNGSLLSSSQFLLTLKEFKSHKGKWLKVEYIISRNPMGCTKYKDA